MGSIINASISVEHLVEVLVIDSSDDFIFKLNKQFLNGICPRNLSFRHLLVKPRGIYSAMNYAIENALGLYVNFMHSGDIFLAKFNLSLITSLIAESDFEPASPESYPYLLYGRTLVQSCMTSLKYLNPPLNVIPNRRRYWNYVIPPGHQACFFLRTWHIANHYSLDIGSTADRYVIQLSIIKSVFIDVVICSFRLSGTSSLNNLKPINYLSRFLQIKSPIIKFGFWPKIFIKHVFGKNWEYIRRLRLFFLSLFVF
ncbi:hypothetical protein [Synechococcus sp. PROS-9-1]|uniref:hypothetical protein n=1 Tax=Synechococcus sp. PROS-9-1 TaxID=1968775 RepID=UPI0016466542|nr:hypothetical protein [Synechococcus sp. PROS-9-1]